MVIVVVHIAFIYGHSSPRLLLSRVIVVVHIAFIYGHSSPQLLLSIDIVVNICSDIVVHI